MRRGGILFSRRFSRVLLLSSFLSLVILTLFSFSVWSLELEQGFAFNVDLTLDENGTLLFLELSNSTQEVIENNGTLNFAFEASYSDTSLVECRYLLKKNLSNVVNTTLNEGNLSYEGDMYLGNGNYSWEMRCLDVNDSDAFNYLSGNFTIDIDYSPIIVFSASNYNVKRGDSITFYLNISSIVQSEIFYLINTNDSENFGSLSNGTSASSINENFSHIYNSTGSYEATLTVLANGNFYDRNLSIRIDDAPANDSRDPIVTLLKPDHNSVITSDKINFLFKASDNVGIANCTLNIYYYNSSVVGSLKYSTLKTTVKNNSEIGIELGNFDQGDYSWKARCYDISSNFGEKSRDFSYLKNNLSVSITSKENATSGNNSETFIDDSGLANKTNELLINEEKRDESEGEAEENIPGSTGEISGFASFVSPTQRNKSFYFGWFVFFTLFVFMSFIASSSFKIWKWRENGDFRDAFKIILAIRKELRLGNVEEAKEWYRKAQEMYPSLSGDCKPFIFNWIGILRGKIDEREAKVLIRDFFLAMRENRRRDALSLYGDIKQVYDGMPTKYKRIVDNEIAPQVSSL